VVTVGGVPKILEMVVAGELAAGEMVAGELVAGELVAGERVAGELVVGELVAGELVHHHLARNPKFFFPMCSSACKLSCLEDSKRTHRWHCTS
jgi:hypothetical protein